MRNIFVIAPEAIVYFFWATWLLVMIVQAKSQKAELLWGCVPIINNKYWSRALGRIGASSKTLMSHHYSANKYEDFDIYFDDLLPRKIVNKRILKKTTPLLAMYYTCRNASVFHGSYFGGPLGQTKLWWLESWLFKRAGVKTVIMPFGADAYQYSQVKDPSFINALLTSYPLWGRKEEDIRRRIKYWAKNADFIMNGFLIDGIGRWDITVPNFITIDTEEWLPTRSYSMNDGRKGVVKIIHTPNHRGFKGSEFIVDAVKKLKQEGLNVELTLLEGVSNDVVKERLAEADILIEQLVFTGYAMSALEGMATGISVVSNLASETYTRMFRRYSFLNECPITSATPETIVKILRELVTNPALRQELGLAGRKYVEKYHSDQMAIFLFGKIHKKLLDNEDGTLMHLFHPLTSEYVHSTPLIQHPLKENKIPWLAEN